MYKTFNEIKSITIDIIATTDKFRELRNSKNLTQEELAEIFNISRNSAESWENPNKFKCPKILRLLTIADFYNVTIDELIITKVINSESEAHEEIKEYVVESRKIKTKYPSYRYKLFLDENKIPLSGYYFMEENLNIRLNNGYLNDYTSEEGITYPAIEDETHTEHWINGKYVSSEDKNF